MESLRHNGRGVPVPYFVKFIDGKPDFRFVDQRKMVMAVRKRLCFLCGERLGRHLAFLVGPMCTVNRISAEPPNHRECAEYAVKACPFLAQPTRTRREPDPGEVVPPAGCFIERNPGVIAIWMTEGFRIIEVHGGAGALFKMNTSAEVIWYTRGRLATRHEVVSAMEEGLPSLAAPAAQEGLGAMQALQAAWTQAQTLLPPQHGATGA